MPRSQSLFALAALALGLALGAWIAAAAPPWLQAGAAQFEAIGALWLNALRMTVTPLIFALIVLGVATVADASATGRLAARALILFAVLLVIVTIYVAFAVNALLTLWPAPRAAADAFVASLGATPPQPPVTGSWLADLAPANPFKAAADGAILPLVVFALFLGFAATRLSDDLKAPFLALFTAIRETMITIVRWVLLAAPIGVFALALGVGARAGIGAAGVLAHYVAIVSLVTAGVTVFAQILASTLGGAGFARFAAAAAPAQVVALTTQSSLATLPIMVARARDALAIPERVVDLVLPLAVAVFRLTSPVANLAVAFYVAHLYAIAPPIEAIIAAMAVAFGVSIASVGLPGQVSFMASLVPISQTLGLPIAPLPILQAVEMIPDIFRTIGNVTADLAAAVLLKRDASK
jgi:proton glutamate symport protein